MFKFIFRIIGLILLLIFIGIGVLLYLGYENEELPYNEKPETTSIDVLAANSIYNSLDNIHSSNYQNNYLALELSVDDVNAIIIDMIRKVNPDYLILSQHFINNEVDTRHHVYNTKCDILEQYVSQIIQGLDTGDFAFVGHPDIINCSNVSKIEYEIQFTRLCEYAKNNGYPLELNLLGIRENRHYPSDEFFKIAGQAGCDVVIGYDAHDAQCLLDTTQLLSAKRLIEKYNLNLITEPFIK